LRSPTKKTATPTTVLKTALTPSLSLKILFEDGKIIRTEILKEKTEEIIPDFLPYYMKVKDPEIGVELLNFKGINKKCLKIYLKLKKLIPFGSITTYGELGKILKVHPRFIGYCMKKNPFPVLIPCHRVISQNSLGGFSYGLEVKRELLKHEGLIL